jgi:phospholipase C
MRAVSRVVSRVLGVTLAAAGLWTAGPLAVAKAAPLDHVQFDHVYVIILENHGFDDALFNGPSPFLRGLAETQGLATHYFGVAHPSLPNYLAMVGGDDFAVRDDAPSCFASDIAPSTSCHKISGDSLPDQLQRVGLSFALYAESLPAQGSLATVAPGGLGGALYAQKHNPLPYFDWLVAVPRNLAQIKPYTAFAGDLAGNAPNVAFIVPNQCHDGHGLTICRDRDQLIADYDDFVRDAVTAIRASKNFTRHSAIVITFDEGERTHFVDAPVSDYSRAVGGADNHIATVVATLCGAPRKDAARYDHFSLLATIEDGFGLPRLRKSADAPSMSRLFQDACAP